MLRDEIFSRMLLYNTNLCKSNKAKNMSHFALHSMRENKKIYQVPGLL